MITYELRRLSALLVFDPIDEHARQRGVAGPFPRPIVALRHLLVARVTAGGPEPFLPPRPMVIRRTESGFDLFFGLVRTPEGEVRREHLPDGDHVVRVESRCYRPWEQAVPLPRPAEAVPVILVPNAAYPFATASTLLRGSVHATDGQPLGGVGIDTTIGTTTYATTTEAGGDWFLLFPERVPAASAPANVTVNVCIPGEPVQVVAQVPVQPGRETTLTQTGLRGWVTRGGLPVAGTTVEVAGRPGQARTGSDGGWFYYFPFTEPAGRVAVRATLPDGASLEQPDVEVIPRAGVVVPTFRF